MSHEEGWAKEQRDMKDESSKDNVIKRNKNNNNDDENSNNNNNSIPRDGQLIGNEGLENICVEHQPP